MGRPETAAMDVPRLRGRVHLGAFEIFHTATVIAAGSHAVAERIVAIG
jgi:hypothetical protein